MTLAPWPPSARHHHGFLRAGINFKSYDWPVAMVDGQVCSGSRYLVELHDQRRAEWMEFYTAHEDELKGHPCRPAWVCALVAIGEVLALAVAEGCEPPPWVIPGPVVPPYVMDMIEVPLRCDVCKEIVGTASVRWDGGANAVLETNGEMHEDRHLSDCVLGNMLQSGVTRGVSIDMDEP